MYFNRTETVRRGDGFRAIVRGTPHGDLVIGDTVTEKQADDLGGHWRVWNAYGVPEAIKALVAEDPD